MDGDAALRLIQICGGYGKIVRSPDDRSAIVIVHVKPRPEEQTDRQALRARIARLPLTKQPDSIEEAIECGKITLVRLTFS